MFVFLNKMLSMFVLDFLLYPFLGCLCDMITETN